MASNDNKNIEVTSRKNNGNLSLHPVKFNDAVKCIVQVKPPKKEVANG